MKRYLISSELKEAIRNSGYSLDKLTKLLNFSARSIIYYNSSIRDDVLQRLNQLLKLDFHLEEIEIDHTSNLGMNAYTKPIKSIKESEDLAELIGIILGDGNMCKNQICIFFDSRDVKYIKYVKKLFNRLTGIEMKGFKHKNKNCFRLYSCNKYLAEKLIDFGLKRGDKIINQVRIPDWIKQNKEYSRMCLRGLVDTDGYIIFCKRDKNWHIGFSNHNKKLIEDFKEVALNLGYHFAKANQWNTRLYRKAEVVRFINDVKPFKSVVLGL